MGFLEYSGLYIYLSQRIKMIKDSLSLKGINKFLVIFGTNSGKDLGNSPSENKKFIWIENSFWKIISMEESR